MTAIVTIALLLLTAAAWIGADIWLFYRRNCWGEIGGYTATISCFVLVASKQRPIIAFGAGLIVGVLAGHFWWSQN
jgi:hypothetical protein